MASTYPEREPENEMLLTVPRPPRCGHEACAGRRRCLDRDEGEGDPTADDVVLALKWWGVIIGIAALVGIAVWITGGAR